MINFRESKKLQMFLQDSQEEEAQVPADLKEWQELNNNQQKITKSLRLFKNTLLDLEWYQRENIKSLIVFLLKDNCKINKIKFIIKVFNIPKKSWWLVICLILQFNKKRELSVILMKVKIMVINIKISMIFNKLVLSFLTEY